MPSWEIDAYIRAYRQKEKNTDTRIAVLLTQICNTLCAVHGVKSRLKVEDFIGRESRQMDDQELLARARALFPKI